MRITLSIVAAVLLTAGPAAAQTAPAPKIVHTTIDKVPMVELYDGGGGLPYLGATGSYNAGDWEPALRTYHDSGVYEKQVAQVDKVAEQTVRKATRKKSKKLAMVFDVDETVLSNYSAIVADNFTFGPNSQAEATNEIGVAIKPSLALYKLAVKRGVAIFFITGRGEATRAHTESNLKREGYTTFKQLVLKPAGTTLTTVAYKSGARAAIEKQGYKIIANVGDQYSDLAGGHAAAAFKLANPFYFLP